MPSTQSLFDSLRRTVVAARKAIKVQRYDMAQALASNGLKDLYAIPFSGNEHFELAVDLLCIRGMSICLQGTKLYLAQDDFERAGTLARLLPDEAARQRSADASLNLALAMLCQNSNPNKASQQLRLAESRLRQCNDEAAPKVFALIHAPRPECLAALRY